MRHVQDTHAFERLSHDIPLNLSHDIPLNSYIVWFTIPGAYTSGSSHSLISDDGSP
jgi:hypothetical protein